MLADRDEPIGLAVARGLGIALAQDWHSGDGRLRRNRSLEAVAGSYYLDR
jgi:hypothetical protein